MRIKHMKNNNTSNNKNTSKNFLFRKSFSIKNLSTKVKVITAFILGLVVSGGAAYAATIIFNADQVGFDNTGTSLSSTDVQGALDELYAKTNTWIDPAKTMQTFDESKYLRNIGDSATLTDLRDGNTYTVKRLEDYSVWMTENLRIVNKTLTPALSDTSSRFTIPASSVSGFSAQDTNNAYVYSTYGGYYTWYTATAGTGSASLTSGDAPSSICPKGWMLPTSSQYETLYNFYNQVSAIMDEPGLVFSGGVYDSSINRQGSNGYYWSSTAKDTNNAYIFRLSSSKIDWYVFNAKPFGASVRCIARY